MSPRPATRRVRFSWPEDFQPIWTPRYPELAVAANAVSLLMPHAEPYVVAQTRAALAEGLVADDEVRTEAEAYIAQESQHHAQHRRLNALLIERYAALGRLDRAFARTFAALRRRSTRFGLAFAAAFETIAFVSARWMDQHLSLMRDADPTPATLFLWHLAEEVEHKGVAHDVYQAAGGGRIRYQGAMATAAAVLSVGALVGSLTMLAGEGKLWSPTSHLRLIRWSLSFIFVAMPVMFVSALASHHPEQLTDPAGFEHWLENLDPQTSTVPEWALP